MQKTTLIIPNISCGHCVAAIKNEISEMDGVSRIDGVAENKSITVHWDSPATLDRIREKLADINYPADA